jgi:hypothetical protein
MIQGEPVVGPAGGDQAQPRVRRDLNLANLSDLELRA